MSEKKEEYGAENGSFTDAAYIPRDQLPNMPRVYRSEPERESTAEAKPRHMSAWALVGLCIVSMLLGAGLNELTHRRHGNVAEIAPLSAAEFAAREMNPQPTDGSYLRTVAPGTPYMGLIVQTVSQAVADYYNQYNPNSAVEGAQVFAVDETSGAQRAGLQRGDIITRLGDKDIRSASDLTVAEESFSPGESTEVQLYRGGENISLHITFGEHGADTAPNGYFSFAGGW